MRKFLICLAAVLALGIPAVAQTQYDIPDGTGVDYLFYPQEIDHPEYTNTFFDVPLTIAGVGYTASGYLHFVEGDPAATSGSVTFSHFVITNTITEVDQLTNVNFNPFSKQGATATANFQAPAGGPFGFSGSLTLNIQQITLPHCFRYCQKYILTTVDVNGVPVPSNFTLGVPQASIYKCGSDGHACFHKDATLADGGPLLPCPPQSCGKPCYCPK